MENNEIVSTIGTKIQAFKNLEDKYDVPDLEGRKIALNEAITLAESLPDSDEGKALYITLNVLKDNGYIEDAWGDCRELINRLQKLYGS